MRPLVPLLLLGAASAQEISVGAGDATRLNDSDLLDQQMAEWRAQNPDIAQQMAQGYRRPKSRHEVGVCSFPKGREPLRVDPALCLAMWLQDSPGDVEQKMSSGPPIGGADDQDVEHCSTDGAE